jgi:hypothetical protein
MVAAAGADELEQAGVTAVETSVGDAGRLAPHERRPAVAGLTCGRECHGTGRDAQPRVMLMVRTRRGDGGRADSRSGICRDVGGAGTAHTTHRQAVVPAAAGIQSSGVRCCQRLLRLTEAMRLASPSASFRAIGGLLLVW